MRLIDRLEHATGLDPLVQAGQRAARLVRPGRIRDVLHGIWLGHPLHPLLAQAATGAWLSAGVLDCSPGQEEPARLLTAVGLAAAGPAALAGAADWSEQHEQQMRVGVVHAMANALAIGLCGTSPAVRGAAPQPAAAAVRPGLSLRDGPARRSSGLPAGRRR